MQNAANVIIEMQREQVGKERILLLNNCIPKQETSFM